MLSFSRQASPNAGEPASGLFQVAGQELGQVDTADVGELVELGAAGEAVSQDHRVLGVAHGGQQGGFRDGLRDVIVAALDAEVPG